MNYQRLTSLLIASICLGPSVAYGESAASPTDTVVAESPKSQTETNETITLTQLAFVIAFIVLVALVVLLAAGFYIYAIDTETPEQRFERKRTQEELKAAAVALSVHYATTTALKKLK